MALVCTHCSRVNSDDARYCYNDGASLAGLADAAVVANRSFFTPFVFPSGTSCKDFDEFALGCQENWDAAVDLLHQGFLQHFFGTLGRLDLARFAHDAANFPDRDRALDQFLARLPGTSVPPAKLDVAPKAVELGTLKIGSDSYLELTLLNQGAHLIFGTLSTECDWLRATESGEPMAFQFRDRKTVVIELKGKRLRAGSKPTEANVLIESNAGTFNVTVTANVPIQEFPHGCLAGSRSPREIAEKAKKFPKEAGILFARGEVAQWYESNGWTYPVHGPSSSGRAAVQQFFEALGLSKPPKVFISQTQIQLKGAAGAKLTHQLQVCSEEQRPVYAHGSSTADWCVVMPGLIQGNVVTLPVEILVPANAGDTDHAMIRVMSNGQQRFDITVQVTADKAATAVASSTVVVKPGGNSKRTSGIKGPTTAKTKTKSQVDIDLAAKTPSTNKEASAEDEDGDEDEDDVSTSVLKRPLTLAILGGVVVVVLVSCGAVGMIAMKMRGDGPPNPPPIVKDGDPPDDGAGKEKPFNVVIQDEPDDGVIPAKMPVFIITDEPQKRIGDKPAPAAKVELKDEKEEPAPSKGAAVWPAHRVHYNFGGGLRWGLAEGLNFNTNKRLTSSATGATNTTVVRMNNQSFFAHDGFNLQRIPDDPLREAKQRSSSIVTFGGTLRVTQFLEIVPSKQPVKVNGQDRRELDTVQARYLFENLGQKPILNAGLRLEVDTFMGSADGAPFAVPGKGMVSTSAELTKPGEVPDFIQAMESSNIQTPGTVAHLSFKLGGTVETPARVYVCKHGTNGNLGNFGKAALAPIGKDSAVVMVWPDQNLQPGQTREMGYAYGLGTVAVADPDATLASSLGGSFGVGQSFTIVAYVNKPGAEQTVKLELPLGLKLIKGEETQKVPAAAANTNNLSIVSWEAKVLQSGVFQVKLHSSTGIKQTRTITIPRGDSPTGGAINVDLKGSFEPGDTFTVLASVKDPIENQKLTLYLPEGLQRVTEEESLLLPAPPEGSTTAEVKWEVRVIRQNTFKVRVASNTGTAHNKKVTFQKLAGDEGGFVIDLAGDFIPGRTFTVSTKVARPVSEQKLTLEIPKGLTLVDGEETQTPRAGLELSWTVKIEKTGKYPIGVKSIATNLIQCKTMQIDTPGEPPGGFKFDIPKSIRVGKDFKITAQVTSPTPNQELSLKLPFGMDFSNSEPRQTVAPAAEPGGTSTVSWTVRVNEPGRYRPRVESSKGLIRSKTMTLSEK